MTLNNSSASSVCVVWCMQMIEELGCIMLSDVVFAFAREDLVFFISFMVVGALL